MRQKRIILLDSWLEIIEQLIYTRRPQLLLQLVTAVRTGIFPDPVDLLPAERELFDSVRAELDRRAEVAQRRREAARRRRAERRKALTQTPAVTDETHRAIREYRLLTDSFLPAFTAFLRGFPGQKPKSDHFSLFLLQQRFPDTWPEIVPQLKTHLRNFNPKRAPSFAQFLDALAS